MNTDVILQFIDLLVMVLYIAVLVRVVLSWFPQAANNPFGAVVFQVTEPLMAPIRRVVPRLGMFDLTPTITLLLLYVLQQILHSLLRG